MTQQQQQQRSSKDEDAPTLESLEPIRQSIRRIALQDQFMWDQSWKSVLSDINETRRGLLLPDVFQQTLALNDIALTRLALLSVISLFQSPNGLVHAYKFLHWIDLSKPRDHVDPELVFARLPQPYRRIVKVLETDILDAAWETIKRTSARFKAESTAGLSARSARSSVLLLPQGGSGGEDVVEDDYATAKKRCGKPKGTVPVEGAIEWMRLSEDDTGAEGGAERQYAVMGLTGGKLVLVDVQSRATLIQIEVTPASLGCQDTEGISVKLLSPSRLRGRAHQSLALAIHAIVSFPSTSSTEDAISTTTESSYVLLYEFSPTAEAPVSRCLATLPSPSTAVTAIELSLHGSQLAVATADCNTTVYSIDFSTEATTSTQILAQISSDSAASKLFFLYSPLSDLATRPTRLQALEYTTTPSSIALIAGSTLIKSPLPSSPLPSSSTLTWPHLAAITSAYIDPTSQYITLGLADGLVVVWDVLEDRDHAVLAPSGAETRAPIDCVLHCGEHFVVSLSLSSQRLQFYDLSDRARPTLVRCVLPPPASQSTETASAPPRFVALSTTATDLPIVLVEYSNGYALLYDVRNGEAMGSVRIAKPSSASASPSSSTQMNSTAVVAVQSSPCSSLAVFDWGELLSTAFPALPRAVQDQRLAASTDNLKRVFIASVDLRPLTLSLGARPTLHSLLLASAGHNHSHSHPHSHSHSSTTLADSKSSSSLARSTHTDSRSSINAQDPTPPQPPLPSLLGLSPCPYRPSIAALVARDHSEELLAADRDAKLHRRRNDLLKILTAAW